MTRDKESPRKPRFSTPTLTGEARKRLVRGMLILLAAFLTFGGPTYLIYILKGWITSQVFLSLLGLASLIAGLVLFIRLLGKEGKT